MLKLVAELASVVFNVEQVHLVFKLHPTQLKTVCSRNEVEKERTQYQNEKQNLKPHE